MQTSSSKLFFLVLYRLEQRKKLQAAINNPIML